MSDESNAAAVPDMERGERIQTALREANLDALLCSIPSHVLLLTGYWPVMGNTVALFTRDGAMRLVLPEDEKEIAARTSVAECTEFKPATLEEITNSEIAIRQALPEAVRSIDLDSARFGVETCGSLYPASYLAQFRYRSILNEAMREAFPRSNLIPADDLLERLSMSKTSREWDRLRLSCAMARSAYEEGGKGLQTGLREPAAAELFHSAFSNLQGRDGAVRSNAFFFCMSGPNSAKASTAYARTRERAIGLGDLVMIHCNSNADGFWTDITRTYTCGKSRAKQGAMRSAILEARGAALARISAGTSASEVDKAARDVLSGRGFGNEFKHATGHGVCFAAANHDAIPRIHPKSPDVLEAGMTFNIEPAIYIDGYGGMRHCDVVAVTARGAEVLTDFQTGAADLECNA